MLHEQVECMPKLLSGTSWLIFKVRLCPAGPVPEEDPELGETMRGVVRGTKLFQHFTLQKVLGRGGMGIVWLAHDDRLDRLVALKLVPEAVCFDPSAKEELKRATREVSR